MVLTDTSPNGWSECEPGSLGRFAILEKSRVRNRRVTKMVGFTAILALCFVAWNTFWPSLSTSIEPNYGGIVCTKVLNNAKAHLAGTLDKPTSSKIDLHLKQCPRCLVVINQMRSAQASSVHLQAVRQRYVATTTMRESVAE